MADSLATATELALSSRTGGAGAGRGRDGTLLDGCWRDASQGVVGMVRNGLPPVWGLTNAREKRRVVDSISALDRRGFPPWYRVFPHLLWVTLSVLGKVLRLSLLKYSCAYLEFDVLNLVDAQFKLLTRPRFPYKDPQN